MKESVSAVVFGATGLVGKELIRLLENETEFSTYKKVFAPVRKAIILKSVTPIITSFENLTDFDSLPEVRDVFYCIGTTLKNAGSKAQARKIEVNLTLNIAEYFLKYKNAKNFIYISSLGADINSRNYYLKNKGDVESSLANLGYERVIIVRPSLLLGSRSEFRLEEKVAEYLFYTLNPLLMGSLKKYRAIKGETVARAMLRSIASEQNGVQIIESDKLQIIG